MMVEKPVIAMVDAATVRQVSKPVTMGDARCINLNKPISKDEEPFIDNYVKTARYSCWNIVCLVCRSP